MPKTRNMLINLCILFVVMVLCLILSEFLARALFPVEFNMERHYTLSNYGIFSRQLNLKFDFYTGTDGIIQPIKLNSQGLRDYEYDYYNKNKSVYRIAFAGDSFIDSYHVQLDEIVPKLLEKKLKKIGDYEVLDFGVMGFGTVPEAVLIEEEVMETNPDMIILGYYIGNDLEKIDWGAYNTFPPDFWLEENHSLMKKEVYHTDFRLKVRSFFRRNSALYFLAKKTFRNIKSSPETIYTLNAAYNPVYSPSLDYNLNTTYRIFKFLDKLTKENNVSFVVVLIPTKEQVDSGIYERVLKENNKTSNDYDLEKPQREIKNILNSLNISYFDLLPDFREKNINNSFYWDVNIHFNREGDEETAKLIYRYLIADPEFLKHSPGIISQ